jgi:hypothetical protein
MCTMCGCTLETGEEWQHGAAWNRRPQEGRDEALEEAAKVADDLGYRFEAGAQKFISSDPERHEMMENRAGGCWQAAKAIRALKHEAAEDES